MPEYPSRRSVVRALNGMVAASHPLASVAGLRILQEGGNAIDAAVATAAVLNVVEPMSTGIGGDLFALVWIAREKKLYALNGSGRAPAALSPAAVRMRGAARGMPTMGWLPVTVPGTVDAWAELMQRFGTMRLSDVLAPAVRYAAEGFPVSEIVAQNWAALQPKLDMNPAAARAYLNRDEPPRVGSIHKQPDLANTLRVIGEDGRDVFYQGGIADRIVAYSQQTGGFLSKQDFAEHTSTWEEPLSTTYRDLTVYECPPNGQGIVALETLNILEGLDMRALEHNSAEYVHPLVEALKLAFADGLAHIADPACVPVPVERMLNKEYAAERRALIDPARALVRPVTGITGSDTVYLNVVDQDRNCVSLINSLYEGFGSGIVVPDTGICLQNRGGNFSLDPASPNVLAPRKRPYHTIIPAMAFKNDLPWLVFGVMGGFMQPQGHVQVLLNTIDFGMDPQRALDAPRVRVYADGSLALEATFDNDTRMALSALGHKLMDSDGEGFGGGQMIMLDPETGALAGGSDPRKDGCAIGF